MPSPSRPPGFAGVFRTDDPARDVYAESAGVQRERPLAVAVPRDDEDVAALVAWAAAGEVPLVPRGSGSSMSGAAVGRGVIVDLGRLAAVGEVDAAWEQVAAGAGATRDAVAARAADAGLRFPVDPSSGAFATIGGMVATNAAGARSLRFGPTRPWVRELECVFADGSRAVVRRGAPLPAASGLATWHALAAGFRDRCSRLVPRGVRKDSSGYGVHAFADSGDLVDLLVGSEGTLAIVTRATLGLAPLANATGSLLTAWRTLDDAMRGAGLAEEAGATACELLERTFLEMASGTAPPSVPGDTQAVLLIECEDASTGGVAERVEALGRACRRAGATRADVGLDAETEQRLWQIRHAASPALARLDPHLRSMQLVEDGCVPPVRLAEYVQHVRAALDRARLRGVIFGHAADANLHVNALVDVRDADWRSRVRQLFAEVVDATAALGGTLTGEHGDGRLRTPSLARFWPADALALFGELKHCLDPLGLLNPGVKVPAHALVADPLAQNKYDPLLPPLDGAARAVLDLVERERRYAVNRLEMLDRTG